MRVNCEAPIDLSSSSGSGSSLVSVSGSGSTQVENVLEIVENVTEEDVRCQTDGRKCAGDVDVSNCWCHTPIYSHNAYKFAPTQDCNF